MQTRRVPDGWGAHQGYTGGGTAKRGLFVFKDVCDRARQARRREGWPRVQKWASVRASLCDLHPTVLPSRRPSQLGLGQLVREQGESRALCCNVQRFRQILVPRAAMKPITASREGPPPSSLPSADAIRPIAVCASQDVACMRLGPQPRAQARSFARAWFHPFHNNFLCAAHDEEAVRGQCSRRSACHTKSCTFSRPASSLRPLTWRPTRHAPQRLWPQRTRPS